MGQLVSETMRLLPLTALACALYIGAVSNDARAQSDARQRQAAAEAYDQGTAAYLSSDFQKAAEWFETAHRLAPAPAALIQAARSHEKAGNLPRATTLGLRLTVDYPDDQAAPIGQGIIDQYAATLVRVDVICEECSLDLDGTLQEFHSFFLEPDTMHTVVAGFETGERASDVSGSAGEVKTLEFSAPPPQEVPEPTIDDDEIDERPARVQVDTSDEKLAPVFTYVGAGLTGALLVGSIVMTMDTNSSADEFEEAAMAWNECETNCDPLLEEAEQLLEDGEGKETVTTVLWVATGAAAAGTLAIALLFTDWSGGEDDQSVRLRLAPDPQRGGGFALLEGRF